MTARQLLADRYLAILTSRLGCTAHVDDYLDVVFELNGRTYVVRNTAPDDPEFLCLTFGVGVADAPAALVDRLAHEATHRTKAVKVSRQGTALFAAVEMFVGLPNQLPDPGVVAAVLPRACSAIEAAVSRVAEGVVLGRLAEDAMTETEVGA